MRREVEVFISGQAKLLLKNLKGVSEDEFLDWFCEVRRISAGGGDLIDFLAWREKNG